MDKESVSRWHRTHRKHHVEYPNYKKWDFEQMIIDWECARITKADKPMTAFETYNWYISNYKFKDFDSKFIFIIAINVLLKELKLWN